MKLKKQKIHCVCVKNISRLIIAGELIAFCSYDQMKHKETLCGVCAPVNVKTGGTYRSSNHCALKGLNEDQIEIHLH
jgi:hypothetical protein